MNTNDRFDPANLDRYVEERRTTVREIRVSRDTEVLGHGYRIEVPVGPNTVNSITLNAAELRAWAETLSDAADET